MRRYLIVTDTHGDILAELDETPRNALDGPLFRLSRPTDSEREAVPFEVPLRAFSAQVVDSLETVGTGDFKVDEKLLDVLKIEKATEELARIERWAKENPA